MDNDYLLIKHIVDEKWNIHYNLTKLVQVTDNETLLSFVHLRNMRG